MAARSLYSGEAGSIESITWLTFHSRFSSTIERCIRSVPTHSKRRLPNGVKPLSRSCPPFGAAGLLVRSLARPLIVPWQSVQPISTDSAKPPYSLPLPCTSCSKWQSEHCMPFSAWMSFMWTALSSFLGSSGAMTLFFLSSRLPWRSCL